jgi:2-isopropylmalate synthase
VRVGQDAQGEVTVKIEGTRGESIIGLGLSTDVIEASVRAYLDAINKLLHRHEVLKEGRVPFGV